MQAQHRSRLKQAQIVGWHADTLCRQCCLRVGVSFEEALAGGPMLTLGERWALLGVMPIARPTKTHPAAQTTG